jgi:hypothetical protein
MRGNWFPRLGLKSIKIVNFLTFQSEKFPVKKLITFPLEDSVPRRKYKDTKKTKMIKNYNWIEVNDIKQLDPARQGFHNKFTANKCFYALFCQPRDQIIKRG